MRAFKPSLLTQERNREREEERSIRYRDRAIRQLFRAGHTIPHLAMIYGLELVEIETIIKGKVR